MIRRRRGRITYHRNGLLHQVDHANGMTDTHTNDPADMARPANIAFSGSSTLDLGAYAYDGVGNVKTVGADSFVYDRKSRLASATVASQARSYAYDDFGNITQLGATSYDAEWRSNHLSTGTYDPAGNLTNVVLGGEPQQYDYDVFNQMKTIQSPSVASGYLYTAAGERLAELDFTQDPWREVWSIRGLDGKVLRQWLHQGSGDGGWRWEKDYVYRDGLLLATELKSEETQHFHLDHLGTPRLVTRGVDGGQVAAHTYFPFGEEITDSSQDAERMKFTGHERDSQYPPSSGEEEAANPEDDLDYMHARYCSPFLGRFLSVDPIDSGTVKNPQGWNRYSYTLNNPIRFVDRDGNVAETPWDAFNVGLGGASLAANIVSGNVGGAALDAGGLLLDLAATALPGIPGGASSSIRAARTARAAARQIRINASRGRAFEGAVLKALGIGRVGPKVRIQSLTGTARFRVPDALTDRALIEIKSGADL